MKLVDFNCCADDLFSELIDRHEAPFGFCGMRNRDLRRFVPEKTCTQILRILKRLRVHGLLKRAGSTYKYYLTKLGRLVLLAGLKLKELLLIPQLAHPQTSSQSAPFGLAVPARA